MVAGRVGSFGVVPVLRCGQDVVEVAFAGDDERIQNLGLNRLDHAFNVCPQVRGTRGHLGDFDVGFSEDLIEGGRVLHVVVAEEVARWRKALTPKTLTPGPSPRGRGEEEFSRCRVVQELLRLLRHPRGIGLAGRGREPESATPDVDERQGVEGDQTLGRPDGFRQEVALHQCGGVDANELGP